MELDIKKTEAEIKHIQSKLIEEIKAIKPGTCEDLTGVPKTYFYKIIAGTKEMTYNQVLKLAKKILPKRYQGGSNDKR
jgi:predicted transcriptional regulator